MTVTTEEATPSTHKGSVDTLTIPFKYRLFALYTIMGRYPDQINSFGFTELVQYSSAAEALKPFFLVTFQILLISLLPNSYHIHKIHQLQVVSTIFFST